MKTLKFKCFADGYVSLILYNDMWGEGTFCCADIKSSCLKIIKTIHDESIDNIKVSQFMYENRKHDYDDLNTIAQILNIPISIVDQ